MDNIVTTTSEVEALENARYERITYYKYVEAWVLCINRLYGFNDTSESAFINKMKSFNKFNNIRRRVSFSIELINAYNRGKLTLRAMKVLPIDKNPEIATTVNFWLPVQAYYAIRGIGLATMIALNRGLPSGHQKFLADFSSMVRNYFPYPLCGCCTGDPERKASSFKNLNTSIQEVSKQHNLANLVSDKDIENMIGKSLSTTRKELLKLRFSKLRNEINKEGRRNLNYEERQNCCQKEHPTSICDLVFRMRLNSNYDKPDMYLFNVGHEQDEVKHYKNLRFLTEIIVVGLETLIEKGIGQTEMASLKASFE